MTLDERYDPNKNKYFADLLSSQGYQTTGLNPIPLKRPDNQAEAGVIFAKSKEDLILVLHPNMGTGAVEHKRESRESVIYLGSIIEGTKDFGLAYKFQNDNSDTRNQAKDIVRNYQAGETFDTISPTRPGRFHGYHNLDKNNPVAIRISKGFS